MINLRDSALVFESQVVNHDTVIPVFPSEVDVVCRLLFALIPGAHRPEFVLQVLPLRFGEACQREQPLQFGGLRRQVVFVLEDHRFFVLERISGHLAAGTVGLPRSRLRSAPPVMICAPAAKRSTFRKGMGDGNGRERREDGVDDHPTQKAQTRESVRSGTVSPRRSRIRRDQREPGLPV